MEAFLSLLIFTFPGLVAFFWIQLFGFSPTVRYQGVEILAASAILWIPINVVVLGLYKILSFIYMHNVYYPIIFPAVNNFEDLNNLSNNFTFILFYTMTSIVAGYFISRIISGKFYEVMLEKVNGIRKANNKAPLSSDATVWDAVFSKNKAQIVKVVKLFNDEEFEIGELKNVSRTYEIEKNIVLKDVKLWREIDDNYNLHIEKVFIDIKSGMKIIIYDGDQCQETLNHHHGSKKK